MIVAFSTSSPVASLALISPEGEVLYRAAEPALRRASEACMGMLQVGLCELGLPLSAATGFAADTGPGSFTGVRVGVVLAKTLAWQVHVPCFGATAFDLIDPLGAVVLPNKRGEWFVREPGQDPEIVREQPEGLPGYGTSAEPIYPDAARFAPLMSQLVPIAPEQFVPGYLVAPSITPPKTPFRTVAP